MIQRTLWVKCLHFHTHTLYITLMGEKDEKDTVNHAAHSKVTAIGSPGKLLVTCFLSICFSLSLLRRHLSDGRAQRSLKRERERKKRKANEMCQTIHIHEGEKDHFYRLHRLLKMRERENGERGREKNDMNKEQRIQLGNEFVWLIRPVRPSYHKILLSTDWWEATFISLSLSLWEQVALTSKWKAWRNGKRRKMRRTDTLSQEERNVEEAQVTLSIHIQLDSLSLSLRFSLYLCFNYLRCTFIYTTLRRSVSKRLHEVTEIKGGENSEEKNKNIRIHSRSRCTSGRKILLSFKASAGHSCIFTRSLYWPGERGQLLV